MDEVDHVPTLEDREQRALGTWISECCLDLAAVDIEDGPTLAQLVSDLRALARRKHGLRLRNCPQMLAHTLYKVGDLRAERVIIESYREEEPYG